MPQTEHKFGYNDDIDTGSTPEDIWDGGGLYTWPTAATVVSIVSDNAGDTQDVTIAGTNDSFWPIQETVTLTGLTPVNTTTSFFRINRMFIDDGTTNAGTITASINSNTASIITPAKGQTLQTIYTVVDHPGITPYLVHLWAGMGKAQSAYAVLEFQTRLPGVSAWRTKDIYTVTDSDSLDIHLDADVKLTVGTDIRWCATSVSANNTSVNAGFEIVWK